MEEMREINDGMLTPKGLANKARLLEFLSDPENDWPTRQRYSTEILGYCADNQIYRSLSPKHLAEIEDLALENRKKRSARQRGLILEALFRKAIGFTVKETRLFKTSDDKILVKEIERHFPPDSMAAKEFLDRTEGKVRDIQEIEHSFEGLADNEIDEKIGQILKNNPDLFDKVASLIREGKL
jgi:hypothetical protein